MRKDLLKLFKNGAWASEDDVEAFVEEADEITAHDLTQLLDVLVDRKLAAHPQRHRNRCAAFAAVAPRALDRSLFVPFVRAVGAGDQPLRKMLMPLVPPVNDIEQHAELCKQLGSPDPDARRAVGQLLTQLGGPTALTHLTELVRHRGFAGRVEAMDVMVPKAKHRAIPLLGAVAQYGEPIERARALTYLGDPSVGGRQAPEAVAAMQPALSDPHERVRAEAIRTLAKLVDEEAFFDALAEVIQGPNPPPVVFEALGGYNSPRVLGTLAARLRTGSASVRVAVLEALRAIGRDEVLPLFMEALHLDDAAVRKRATEILSELSTEGKVDLARAILWLLRSQDVQVRRIAAHLARTLGDTGGELTPKMLGFLRDEDWWVRERVMDALVEMAGRGLTEHVVAYLEDPSPVIRRFGIGALLRLRDPQALGAILRSAMNDEDWWVREQAIQAAAELGDPRAIPYMQKFALEQADLRIACIEALSALDAHEALLELAELAADENPDVRRSILRALEGVPDGRKAFLYVKSCLNDPVPRVARQARELLERWEMADQNEGAHEALGLLDRLLVAVARSEADDLMLTAGRRPYVKHLGAVTPISKNALSTAEIKEMLLPHLTAEQRRGLGEGRDVDMSYEVPSHGIRFRVNVFNQMSGLSAVFRRIHDDVPDLEELGLPPLVRTFAEFKNGLVLVGGPTGAGKSTTLAAIIGHINRTDARHVVTIEDPIEVVHEQELSLINQREVGTHTRSFARALRSTLRQDPDVILVGEMRDAQTIEFAVNAAETGHLVFATVHTSSADTSIDRIIHAFPIDQQPQVRIMLAESLRAVVCQHLLRRKDQPGTRTVAAEILLVTDAVANLIRKDKCFQIPTVIATGRDQGMQFMDQELERLVRMGIVDAEEALMKANDKSAFATLLESDGGAAGASMAPTTPGKLSSPATTSTGAAPSPTATGSYASIPPGSSAAPGAHPVSGAPGRSGAPGGARPSGAPQRGWVSAPPPPRDEGDPR